MMDERPEKQPGSTQGKHQTAENPPPRQVVLGAQFVQMVQEFLG